MQTVIDDDELVEAAPEAEPARLAWHQSLFGKTTVFLVLAICLAYCVGASAGWFMLQRNSEEQWRRQAAMNAQVATSTIRSIYTFIAVETDPSGQILRIISERALGDDQSVISTGFNPGDVLALAASQTKNDIWLFEHTEAGETVSLTDALSGRSGQLLAWKDKDEAAALSQGFAEVGDESYYVASLPVVTPDGRLLGSVVASIGREEDLLKSQRQLLWSAFSVLIAILLATGVIVSLLLQKVLRPLPSLIASLSRIAHGDTSGTVPFQRRRDEIGRFAVAIETLRTAVVERETLRQVKETAKQLEHLAHHDALTGLPNRAFFNKRLGEALEAIAVSKDKYNLLLIDLDRFKTTNDSLGHAVGDGLLVAVAERLSLLLGVHDFPARLGGDEFAVIQRVEARPMLEASKLAKALVEAISTPFTILGHEVSIGASIGIAKAEASETLASELLKNADVALYNAKASGRGTYRFYKDGMVMAGANRYALERDLEMATDRHEFELHYQPIVRCADRQLAGYEALIRWRHPTLGYILPDDFIPLAEESGQIVRIGEWVLEQACRDAADMPPHLSVAINVSAAQLHQGAFVKALRAALERHAITPARLVLELTESMPLTGPTVRAAVQELHELGVTIALDDFGTGHSTLVNLLQLPVQRIKIDRSFIEYLEQDAEGRSVVESILGLAGKLGISATAEGVEHEWQHACLTRMGCEYAQGYHYGKPQPYAPDDPAPSKRAQRQEASGVR